MTGTTAWIRPLPEAASGVRTARWEVDGSRCRTSRDLFTEWATRLGFPDHFGHNWDAFRDCLRDVLPDRGAEAVRHDAPTSPACVVRKAGDLLTDEPGHALSILLSILSETAGGDSTAPRLLLFLDDTPDRLSQLTQRMTEAGCPPASFQAHG
ncbi:barstar family protein [Streptomyces scabiei]|uniref:barstar family protein n=1 Tax=Streptomyces scabiei TaxID=1930 RepID=UPI00298F7E18|nr:barstar family protein [Streptomyces scabiei]MDW8805805.1 barstar family protein [Streptomyces scabiei]